jgi:DNA-binding HxlR family transcriptional regulator
VSQGKSTEGDVAVSSRPDDSFLQGSNATQRRLTDADMIFETHEAFSLLASKWKIDVLYLLASGARRYSHLHRQLPVSKKVLTDTLRGLDRDGLIRRKIFAEVPARVEYSLTPLGWSLTQVLMALYEWGSENFDAVIEARARHDAASARPPAPLLSVAGGEHED